MTRLGRLCLLAGLLFAAAGLVADSLVRLEMIRAATAVKTSDIPPGAVKVSPGASERWTVLPSTSADARWWIIHTTEMMRRGEWRVRVTHYDNAPQGREVHWSSLLMWGLAALSGGIGLLSGKGVLETVPEAALWVGPLFFLFALGGLGAMVGRRYGVRLAAFFAACFATSPLIEQTFRLAECDHHGIVLAFSAGCVLALCCGGAGLVLPSRRGRKPRIEGAALFLARDMAARWAVLSGILGGAALWVSAATTVPVLAGCGLGALAAGWINRKSGEGDVWMDPGLWRLWGVAGCCGSLFFYLVEYFPSHLGWRLEVNHPLYALAWLGAAELLARLLLGIRSGRWLPDSPRDWAIALGALVFAILPPLLAALRRDLFFWVSDPFLLSLHVEYIQEFQSLWKLASSPGAVVVLLDFFLWPAFVVLGVIGLAVSLKIPRRALGLLVFPLFPALVMQVLACVQVRWGAIAVGVWVVCATVVAAVMTCGNFPGRLPASLRWALALLAFVAVTVFPVRSVLSFISRGDLAASLPKDLAPPILLRDISHQLIQSSPDKLPVVLSGVNSSSDLSYYGGIRTLGTLYWENLPGLERAGRIFASLTPDEARRRLVDSGITHIVVASWDDFGEAYARLLRRSGKIPPSDKTTFIASLVAGTECPDWLRPLYYPIPPVFGIEDQKVRIFAVVPDQTPQEALIHRAIYFLDAGDKSVAADLLHLAQKKSPSDPRIAGLLAEAEHKPSPASP